jgi:hypothetical protein
MTENEGCQIKGHVIVEELVPGTDIVVSHEEGDNIICAGGATALAIALAATSAPTSFNWMILSTGTTAVARATTAIEATRTSSALAIIPTRVGSVVTWVNTFPAVPAGGAGASPIWKFGMENSTSGSGYLLNEYMFSAMKDNRNNDVKVTYNLSIAP